MQALRRPITTVLLLASYLVASAGVWLHTTAGCRVAPRDHDSCAARACCGVQHTHGGPSQPVARADSATGWCADAPGPSPDHDGDACLLCRFSVISQGMALSQQAAAPSPDVCRPVTTSPPSCAAADRQLTWCCRAPPSVSSLVS
jgi:hypothetical protein